MKIYDIEDGWNLFLLSIEIVRRNNDKEYEWKKHLRLSNSKKRCVASDTFQLYDCYYYDVKNLKPVLFDKICNETKHSTEICSS